MVAGGGLAPIDGAGVGRAVTVVAAVVGARLGPRAAGGVVATMRKNATGPVVGAVAAGTAVGVAAVLGWGAERAVVVGASWAATMAPCCSVGGKVVGVATPIGAFASDAAFASGNDTWTTRNRTVCCVAGVSPSTDVNCARKWSCATAVTRRVTVADSGNCSGSRVTNTAWAA